MLKTLHGYLTRDLLRVMLLALVAITLLMTVLAIIQPLRKLGLAGEQVLHLFAYTLPVMLSFTLPVATLFAATLVYGRFSQDNELLACRASGVSTLSLLRPALGLGAAVTAASLVLSNLVAPNLATMAGVLQANARGILYHRLKTQGYIDIGKGDLRQVIHADAVDPGQNALYGVVYAYVRKPRPASGPEQKARPGGAFLATASAAYLDFVTDPNGEARVVIQPMNPSIIRTGAAAATSFLPDAETMQLVMPLENPVEEKPSWYNWSDLLKTLQEPSRHGEIRRELERLRQVICSDMLAQDIAKALAAGKSYRQFAQGDETYEIEAASAEVDEDGAAVLKSTLPSGTGGRAVTIIVRRSNQVYEMITAGSGKVVISWSPITRGPQVTLKLRDDVRVNVLAPGGRREHRAAEWTRGEIAVPAKVRQRAERIELADLCASPGQYTRNAKVLRSIRYLAETRIPRLEAALIAELHARVAYGVSCFLMVAMGAALGLIFRGGQFISAFAISAVPAAAVIAMLLMGKEMVRNPDVSTSLGLASIWGGIAGLLLANVLIYLHLARK